MNIKFFKDLDINDTYSPCDLDNSVSVFKSINNIFYLIYTTRNFSIISYDIVHERKINEINNSHNNEIFNLKHYLDKINQRDLLLSISKFSLKVWSIKNFECIIKINYSNEKFISSACLLSDINQYYIIVKYYLYPYYQDPLLVFNFEGKKIKEIKNSLGEPCFIDIYYDNKYTKYYIITGNKGYIKAFDYNKNELYKIFDNKYYGDYNISVVINEKENLVQLISSCTSGSLVIWNFHTGEFLKEIKIMGVLFGICLWNENYLFVGGSDHSIHLIDLNKGEEIKVLNGHENYVINVKKIYLPGNGEFLISFGQENDKIKLWIYEK